MKIDATHILHTIKCMNHAVDYILCSIVVDVVVGKSVWQTLQKQINNTAAIWRKIGLSIKVHDEEWFVKEIKDCWVSDDFKSFINRIH